MKSSIQLLTFLLTISFASAQNYFLSPSDSLSGTLDISGPWIKTIPLKIEIINLTASSLKLKWKRIDEQLLPQWSFTICDHEQCYPIPPPMDTTLHSIAPYDTGYLKVTVYDSITAGDGHVKLLLYSSAPEVDTLSYYFSFIVSVPEIPHTKRISVSPLFTGGFLNVSVAGNEQALYAAAIFNIIGQPVNRFRITNGLTVVDVSALPGGFYFLNLIDRDGKTSALRFVKQ